MTRARVLADYVAGGSTAAEFDVLDGLTSTTAELNHVDGVTSNVQTQMNAKAPLASPTFTGTTTVSGDLVPSTPLSNRNMIINGGMQVWQRATATTTSSGNNYQTVDRWRFDGTTDGVSTTEKHDMSLAEINTTGHGSALQFNVTTADTSLGASQYVYFNHRIEAQNLQHLRYGTANAKTITLSFWVKSNKTGTYCAGIVKSDATAYKIFDEYTISSADTWEQKKITFTPTAGSTSLITGAGGIINNDNDLGFEVQFGLAWGSTFGSGTPQTWSTSSAYYASTNQVNWMDSTSNNFYLTGVQLELGSNATPYEHRSYGDELARCSRYFQKYGEDGATSGMSLTVMNTNGQHTTRIPFNTEMRDTPTGVVIGSGINSSGGSVTNTTWAFYHAGAWKGCSAVSINTLTKTSFRLEPTSNDSCTSGGASVFYGGAQTALTFSAEL